MDLKKFDGVYEKNKNKYINELIEWSKIKSVSLDPSLKNEVLRSAEFVVKKLESMGAKNVKKLETDAYPMVYGEMFVDKGKPTILVYGHYDVMPAKKEDGWDTEPFEPVIKSDGYIYGRGPADDKGKSLAILNGIDSLKQIGIEIPVNLKFLFEGDEEVGIEAADRFVKNNKDFLRCDAVLMADTVWRFDGMPSLSNTLRGVCAWDVTVRGANKNLHSGIYGGIIKNPLVAVGEIISKLHDEKGRVLVPGFYDDVMKLSPEDRQMMKSFPMDDEEIKKELDVDGLFGEEGYCTYERNVVRPTMDVTNLWGGAGRGGPMNVLPPEAGFTLSARLVSYQVSEKIQKGVADYLKKVCPEGVRLEVKDMTCSDPVAVPKDNPYVKKLAEAVESVFEKKMVWGGSGASIPICILFQKELKAPVLLFDLNTPDEAIHSPNEKFSLEHFVKGSKITAQFLTSIV